MFFFYLFLFISIQIRYFLSKFRLPGEAQKIDRIMEAFASKYCKDNPSVFSLPGILQR